VHSVSQGNVGGGLATYLTEVLDPGWFDDDDYKSLLVLGGMTAPLGALFQAPMLGALMIHELGEPPKYVARADLLPLSSLRM
jgi:H+/Cl- antiporter ClcA